MLNVLRSTRFLLAVLCLFALTAGSMVAAERSARAMSDRGHEVPGELDARAAKAKASFPFQSDQRTHWHFIPTETFPRQGLLMSEMTEAQRALAHDLLKAGLSQRGYMTATSIMDARRRARRHRAAQRARAGRRAGARPGGGSFAIRSGTSSRSSARRPRTQTWGWRVEGHHVSLHFTVVNGTLVASSPTFFGSQSRRGADGPEAGTAASWPPRRTRRARC